METNREELSRIEEVLKKNPKGMNVIEIARAIGMHRQSVTKYLEMLVVSGHVEVKTFGPSKVYYMAQRLPLSSMLSLSSDLILLLDRDLKIINVNAAFLSFVGASREDVLNKEMSLVSLPLEFDPPIQPYIADALDGKESKIEALFKKKGKEQFFNIKLIPVVFDDGRPGATVLFENVTDQRKAARENEKLLGRLKESEQRFRTLIQNLRSGVLLVESDGKFSIYNPAFLRMFEMGEGEIAKMDIASREWNALEVFDEEGRALSREERPSMKAFATGQPVKDMLIGFRPRADAPITWALVNAAILKAPGGGIDKVICTYYDITERKRREEQVARLTRLYATLSRVNEAFIRVHDEGPLYDEICRIVAEEGGFSLVWIGLVKGQQVIPAAGSGRSSEYLKEIRVEVDGELGAGPTGTCIHEGRAVVNDDFATNPRTAPWREPALRYGIRASAAFPLYRNGRTIGALTVYAGEPHIFDEEQVKLLQSLSSDISSALDALDNEQLRARTERALKDAKAQAELYVDLMGHDIDNMLQIVLGYLEMAREMPPGEVDREFIDRPVEVLQRSARLIQNVRKLQMIQNGLLKPITVDVRATLEDVRREFEAVAAGAIVLETGDGSPCFVRANDLLRDVFANLVTNAIKYSGNGSGVTIGLDKAAENGRPYCRAFVEDQGPGIPDDFKGRVFNRVLKGTDKAKGMGLGLYLVKTLVDSYGGKVWVEDRVEGDHTKGARFVVMLPVVT